MNDKLREHLEKYKNRLANLWQCEPICPVKALEFQNQAHQEIINLLLSEEELLDTMEQVADDAWCGHGRRGEDADIELDILAKAIYNKQREKI